MRVLTKHFIILIVAGCFLVPLLVIILLTVGTHWDFPAVLPRQFSPHFITEYLQHDPSIIPAVINSVIIGVGAVILTLTIAYPLALAMVKYDIKFKWMLDVLIYAPLIIPSIALVTSLDLTFMRWQLTGTWFGIIIVHTIFCLPYATKLLVDNLSLYQINYEDVALNLGANHWQTFFKVTLPLSINGLYGAVFMSFIVSMSQYLTTLLIGSGNHLTIAVNMFPLIQNGRYQAAATYGIIFILTTLIPLFLIEGILRRKVRG